MNLYPDKQLAPTQPPEFPAIRLEELSYEELQRRRVTDFSVFEDQSWFETNLTPGAKRTASTLNWAMTLEDGTRLTDAQHAKRLHWAKVLVLTLLELPASGRRLAPGTMVHVQLELNKLLSWMSKQGYQLPCELTPNVVNHYLGDLVLSVKSSDKEADGDDERGGVQASVLRRSMMALMRLWDQRGALQKMGIEPLPAPPFGGRRANALAEDLATKARGWRLPLPDEVAIPLFNAAARLIGSPADDLIALLEVFNVSKEIYNSGGTAKKQRLGDERGFLANFVFSRIPGEEAPWREPLRGVSDTGKVQLRDLFEDVREAACIIVQGMSGMRINELCGIKAGISSDNGLPRDVRVETGTSGLYEWFVLRSELSKTKEGKPRLVDWVLGMRPVGSGEIPLAVRALIVLNRLHEPWRATAKTDRLLLAGSHGTTLQRPLTPMAAPSSNKVCEAMKRFIARQVDFSNLPNSSARNLVNDDLVPWRESRGEIFTTHMLRKSWANFTLACDARLLPVIQMQFHHLSLAMTEGGYIGNNPLLLDALDSVASQRTAQTIFESLIQRTAMAGRMGAHLEGEMDKLRKEIGDLPASNRWQNVVDWVDSNEIKMFFSAYATCAPIKTSEMRCHDASETPIWIRHQPNTVTREPSLCAGCANAVMDRSHEPFWSQRFVSCRVSLELIKKLAGKIPAEYRVIEFRADQARAILQKMGTDLNILNAKVENELEQHNA